MGLMDTIKGWFGTAEEESADLADKAVEQGSELIDEAEPMSRRPKTSPRTPWTRPTSSRSSKTRLRGR